MRVLSPTYVSTLLATAAVATWLCVYGRRRAARFAAVANFTLAAALLVTTGLFLATTINASSFSVATSLPFALCDLATLVAAAALLTRRPILVELTYFWGLAGTAQALLTPDLDVGFPKLQFFEYVVAHGAIVCAALFLVVGQRLVPRRGSVMRVFAITLAYSAVVGAIDAATGGNYMYLRRPPGNWTLLRVLGPWPWYIATAAGAAVLLFSALDMPFWHARRRDRALRPAATEGDGACGRTLQAPQPAGADARLVTIRQPGRRGPGAGGATIVTPVRER